MKVYAQNKNNILNDILGRVEETNNLLEAEAYITWNSVLPDQIRNLELAREHGKKTFVISHGHNSENDHNPSIIDHATHQNGAKMLADKYLCYGQQGKDILLKSGYKESQIEIVGCPICWEHRYLYVHEKKKKAIGFDTYAGEKVIDPKTKEEWLLKDQGHDLVRHKGGNRVAFFPNHSGHYKFRTKEIYEAIKDLENLCICASTHWLTLKEENPFEELIKDKTHNRLKKIVFPDIEHPENLSIVKNLIQKSSVVICVVPATAALIAYTCGVPVVIPNYDWMIRNDKNERVDIWTKADIVVDPKDIRSTIDHIVDYGIDDERKKLLNDEAIYSAGIELGNPSDNIMRCLNGDK